MIQKIEIINEYINDNFKENNYSQNVIKLMKYLKNNQIKLNSDKILCLINTNTLYAGNHGNSKANRDKLIIAYRYEIKDGKCYILEQIGKMLGINIK